MQLFSNSSENKHPFKGSFLSPLSAPGDPRLCASSISQILLKPRSLAPDLILGEEETLNAWPEDKCSQ